MDQVIPNPRTRIQGFAGEVKPVSMALGLVFGLGVGIAPAASAATITVNNLSGTSVVGQCTLRDAIQAANTNLAVQGCAAGSGADTINFSVAGIIPLTTELQINSDVTISGPGAASLTLRPSAYNRAVNVQKNHTVSISGVTFQGSGTSTDKGAAIYHYAGTLTISNCVFNGNVTTQDGGAIWNYGGVLDIRSSTFTANKGAKGGAIFLYGNTTDAAIQQSTFSGNVATGDGGAIFLYNSGGMTITDSTLSGNKSTGGGGAIYFYFAGNSVITNSTISGNSSGGRGGGAIVLYQTLLAVNNSTITGNSTTNAGGAFYLTDGGSPRLILTSSIVALNTSEAGANDLARANGTIDATNSLIQNPAGNINGVNTANIIGANPLLGPLQNNGGPTLTHALLAGSPAIDKGSNLLALAFDQRGTPYVRSSGVTDIGAYEVQGAPPPPPPANVPVPTLSQWGLALLSAMMAGWAMLTGFGKRRRR